MAVTCAISPVSADQDFRRRDFEPPDLAAPFGSLDAPIFVMPNFPPTTSKVTTFYDANNHTVYRLICKLGVERFDETRIDTNRLGVLMFDAHPRKAPCKSIVKYSEVPPHFKEFDM